MELVVRGPPSRAGQRCLWDQHWVSRQSSRSHQIHLYSRYSRFLAKEWLSCHLELNWSEYRRDLGLLQVQDCHRLICTVILFGCALIRRSSFAQKCYPFNTKEFLIIVRFFNISNHFTPLVSSWSFLEIKFVSSSKRFVVSGIRENHFEGGRTSKSWVYIQ